MREVTKPRTEWHELFDPGLPNMPYLLAVLSKTSPGTVLVDNLDQPTTVVVRSPLGPTFSSQDVSDEFLAAAIVRLRSLGDVSLFGRRAPAGLRNQITITVDRMEFTDCDLNSNQLQTLRDRLPTSIEVRALTEELMDGTRCG